ncbi:MAG: hypothetical protein V4581_05705 [Bacteroidota bacterium]
MKTYVADIIPKIERFSQRLDNITMLVNHHWVVLDELAQSKTVYIFKSNGELIIAVNGKVEKARWEYLGNNALLIDIKEQSYLFRHGFFDRNILALKLDSANEYAVLVNENRYQNELNTIAAVLDFLNQTYSIDAGTPNSLPGQLITTYYVTYMGESYSLRMGTYREYKIKLSNGLAFTMFKKKSNGKYFIYHEKQLITFQNKSTCIDYIERQSA